MIVFLSFLSLMALLLTPIMAKQVDDQAYRYAYVTQASDSHNFFLNIVNPLAPDNAPQQLGLPANSTDRVINADPSPDGAWMVIFFMRDDDETGYFLLVDTRRGQSSRIADVDIGISDYADYFVRRAWSPDSQHYAYIASMISGSDPNINAPSLWMYDVESQQTNLLFAPEIQTVEPIAVKWPYDVSWSENSQSLAILTSQCPQDLSILADQGCDPAHIQIMHIASGHITAERSIDLWPSTAERQREVCNMRWSPDGEKIAFEFACAQPAFAHRSQYFDEILVWDIGNDQLEQVTFHTEPLADVRGINTRADYPNPSWNILYALAWKDAQTLLVGSRGVRTYADNLTAYDLDEGTSNAIIDRFTDKLVLNTQRDKMAFRAVVADFATDRNGFQRIEFSGEDVYITDTAGNILHREPTDSPSYFAVDELRWSPDGRWLGYTIKEMIPNEYGTEFWYPAKFNLINAKAGQVVTFQPPISTKLVDVGGWTIEPTQID